MYKDDSDRLSDYMMLWAYKALPECINYLQNNPDMTIEAPGESIIVRQSESNIPLGIQYSSSQMDPSGKFIF